MDPLSITTGILALLGASIKTGIALKEFCDGVAAVDLRVQALLTDVESFTQVLQMMIDTLGQENIESSLQTTGFAGNHLINLLVSIEDGQHTILQLHATIEKVNKSVSVLDGLRRHIRLKGASDELAAYQQQIRSYRSTLQVSLQTMIWVNQVTIQASTDKLLPSLDDISSLIRRVAFELTDQISGLESAVQSTTNDEQLRSLTNLKSCVKSASSVVSSTSTALSNNRRSIAYGSDFGDCFPPEQNEPMMRWVSSNTIYEYEENMGTESSASIPKLPYGGDSRSAEGSEPSDLSDSDDELEADKVRSLLRLGKDKLASNDHDMAERHFLNCLNRVSSISSTTSLHTIAGAKPEIMTLLLTIYRHQSEWNKAHSLLKEKIALESRGSSKGSHGVLSDTLMLVEILLHKSALSEALLYGRRALKGYKKLGPEGTGGVQDSLVLLCKVCNAAGNTDEEDAYGAILSDLMKQSNGQSATPSNNGQAISPSLSPPSPSPHGQPSQAKSINMQRTDLPKTEVGSSEVALEMYSCHASEDYIPSSRTSPTVTTRSRSSLSSADPRNSSSLFSMTTSISASSRKGHSVSDTNSNDIYIQKSPDPRYQIQTHRYETQSADASILSAKDETKGASISPSEQEVHDVSLALQLEEEAKGEHLVAISIRQRASELTNRASNSPEVERVIKRFNQIKQKSVESDIQTSPLILNSPESKSTNPQEESDSEEGSNQLKNDAKLETMKEANTQKVQQPSMKTESDGTLARSTPYNALFEHPDSGYPNGKISQMEESAIEYFRANRGQPPDAKYQPTYNAPWKGSATVPIARAVIETPDYELKETIWTHPSFPFYSDVREKWIGNESSSVKDFKHSILQQFTLWKEEPIPGSALVESSKDFEQTAKVPTRNPESSADLFNGQIFELEGKSTARPVYLPKHKPGLAGWIYDKALSLFKKTKEEQFPTSPFDHSTASNQPLRSNLDSPLIDMESELDDDLFVKDLTCKGYSRAEAVSALEMHNYNLELARKYLARTANMKPHPTHNRTKSEEKRRGVQDFSMLLTTSPEAINGDDGLPAVLVTPPVDSGKPFEKFSFCDLDPNAEI